jgi:cytoskeletal protein CcmA (bactofilin family)
MSLFNRNDKSGDATIRQQPQTVKPQTSNPQSETSPVRPPQGAQAQGTLTQGTLAQGTLAQGAPSGTGSAALKPAETPRPVSIVPPSPPSAKTGVPMASVISKALKITGQLESTEDIQIDGEIDGDVRGVGVKIGQNAKVKGTVYGDEVELAGTIEGRIESKKVVLSGTARMTGDILHHDIKIESGAYISGNLKPESGKSEVKPALKPVAASSSNVNTPGSSVSPVAAGAAGGVHH